MDLQPSSIVKGKEDGIQAAGRMRDEYTCIYRERERVTRRSDNPSWDAETQLR